MPRQASIPPEHLHWRSRVPSECGRHLIRCHRPDLVGLERCDRSDQRLVRNRAQHVHRVRERPATGTGIKLGDLCVDTSHVGSARERDEHRTEGIQPRVLDEVAADRTEIVVPGEELRDGDELRLGLGRETTDELVTWIHESIGV